MSSLANDLRISGRMLVKNPGFTTVCVLTLALGIGANTAVFSIVNSILFRPLPVPHPEQIMLIAGVAQRHGGSVLPNFSVAEYRDVKAQTSGVFAEVFGHQVGLDGLSINGRADRVVSEYVTGNFFSALGIQPALGRLIRPGEGEILGADPVIVLGYEYWRTHFGGDPAVVGQKVALNSHPFTIVGVASKGFHGPLPILESQIYLPLGMIALEAYPSDIMVNRSIRNLFIMTRLRNAVSFNQAQADLSVASARIAKDHPESDNDLKLTLFPELRSRPNPDPKNTILVISTLFLALSALVLLLACVNVANILLVRATVREREMAIRVALGAARRKLIQQLMIESLTLGLAGGIAGVLLGYWGSRSLSAIHLQTDFPIRLDFGFDWRVFFYALTGALLTGIIVGLVPALRASRSNMNEVLHEGGRGTVGGRQRLRNMLVTAQVGASLTLLIIAGLFTRSLGEAQQIKLGFDPAQVANLTMDPTEIGYNEAQGQHFFHEALDKVRSIPGVVSASFAGATPMGYYNNSDAIRDARDPETEKRHKLTMIYNPVTPDYFTTMRIKLVRGRTFRDADDQNAEPVAIVSEAFAKKLWPGQDPIGRQFVMASEAKLRMRVVGVVADIRSQSAHGPFEPSFYIPLWQHYALNTLETLQVRTSGDAASAIPEVQRVLRSFAPTLPIFDVKTMRQALYTLNGLLMFQIGAWLAGLLGLLGLVLAVGGVYGVISYAATRQSHEIGLRMALGAKPINILQLMLRRGLLIIGVGLVVGLGLTYAAADIVRQFVVISPTDPLTYAAVTALLTAVALLACYIPSRRAMRVDPMIALRCD